VDIFLPQRQPEEDELMRESSELKQQLSRLSSTKPESEGDGQQQNKTSKKKQTKEDYTSEEARSHETSLTDAE
jgi:hypothetical protein